MKKVLKQKGILKRQKKTKKKTKTLLISFN